MTDLIRSAGLSYYPEVARSLGLDPKQMMRKVRLPLACLDKPDTPIAVTSLRRLLELSAELSGAEDFGLRLAERGGLTNFGAVGLIVREQATVGEAIAALSRFIHVHHDGMRLDIARNRQTVTVTLHLRGRQPSAPRQSIDMALGSVHRIIRSLFDGDWRPLEVHLHYPPPHDRKRYRDFFGCPVTFNADDDAILLSAHDMERRIPSAHPLIASYLRKRIEAIETRPAGWDEKVDEVVRCLLASGDCTVERVAEHPSHRSPSPRRRRHQLLGDPRCAARRSRDPVDRRPRPAAGRDCDSTRLLRAECDGALVSQPFRLHDHRLAKGCAAAGGAGRHPFEIGSLSSARRAQAGAVIPGSRFARPGMTEREGRYTALLCNCLPGSRCASNAAATLRTRKRESLATASRSPSRLTIPSAINGFSREADCNMAPG